MRASPRYAFLFGALAVATLVPSLAAWRLVRRYAAIPVLVTGPAEKVEVDSAVSDVKQLGDGEALGIEREHMRVALIGVGRHPRAPRRGDSAAPGRPWAAAAQGSTSWVIDEATGDVHVYESGEHRSSRRITGPGRHEIAADAGGRLLFSEGSGVCRATPALERDASFGEKGCVSLVVPAGLAAVGTRVLVTGGDGEVIALDDKGRVVSRRGALGNVGRLGRGAENRAVMIDPPTGRLWILDEDGREVARIASSKDVPAVVGEMRDVDFDGRVLWVTGAWGMNVYRPEPAR
jgi:hypothetical protein